MVLGKGQEKLPQSAQAPHIHPPSEKFKILEPQAAMVLQRGRFCRTLKQIGAFSFHFFLQHQAKLEDRKQIQSVAAFAAHSQKKLLLAAICLA